MKKLFLSAILIASLSFVSCDKDDVEDALGINCIGSAQTILALGDNPSCSEASSALNKLIDDCGDEDGSIQDLIDSQYSNCEN